MKPLEKYSGESVRAFLQLRTGALLVLCAAVFIVAQTVIWSTVLRGDEPHIVMTTISLLKGRINVVPSYVNQDYRVFGYPALHWQVEQEEAVKGYVPPEHGFTFPAIIAAAYAIGGIAGIKIFVLVISALSLPLLFSNCRDVGLSPSCAALTCVALVCAAPWEFHAALVLPETMAGTMTMGIVWSYLRFRETEQRGYAFAVGVLTVLLPVLYAKYAAIGFASAVLLTDGKLRWNWATYAAAPILILYAVLWLSVYGASTTGTGAHLADFALARIPNGIWRSFVDRDAGEWAWAPITFMAVAGFLRWNRQVALIQGYLVSVVVLYASLYGAGWFGPGELQPGRYLVAALPALVMLAAMGLLHGGALRLLRLAAFSTFTLASAIILGITAGKWRPELPHFYAAVFPRIYYPDRK